MKSAPSCTPRFSFVRAVDVLRLPAGVGKGNGWWSPSFERLRAGRCAGRAIPRGPGRHEPFGDGISGLNESPLDRVARQLDAIAHAELFEDVRTMSLHRLHADDEHLGDLLRR